MAGESVSRRVSARGVRRPEFSVQYLIMCDLKHTAEQLHLTISLHHSYLLKMNAITLKSENTELEKYRFSTHLKFLL